MGPGDLLDDRFELEARVGAGGMGVVYRARDRLLGARVAVKLLIEGRGGDARFVREVDVLAQLRHPAIVRYVAHGRTPAGELYLAMEWLEGLDLAAHVAQGPLPVGEAVNIAAQVAGALAAAHGRGVIHRDIKPSNIWLVGGDPGRIRLLDFGIARNEGGPADTLTGQIVGTPEYMAPEQARGERELTTAVDVFAVGCVLFECLTGTKPFSGSRYGSVLAKILFQDAPRVDALRPGVPLAVAALLERLMAKEAGQRPSDGAALAAELEGVLSGLEGGPPAARLTSSERRLISVLLATVPPRPDAATEPAGAPPPVSAARGIVGRHGGVYAQLHDGSMIVTFAGASVATDLVVRAAQCALALRVELPDAQLALMTGEGQPSDVPVGDIIDHAFERTGAGEAGPIAIDTLTARLLGARFDVREGRGGLELVRERLGTDLGATEAPMLLGQATPFVGREGELRALRDLFDQCVDEPRAGVVLVTAEAGVGKSRLGFELVREVRASAPQTAVWIGRGDWLRAGSAFGLLGQLLRSGLGDGAARLAALGLGDEAPRVAAFVGEIMGLPAPAGGEHVLLRGARQDPRLMAEQVERAWLDVIGAETRRGPLLLVLEDLHWGDPATVRMIDRALLAHDERPLMVLALARPEVHDLFPKIWGGRRLSMMALGELSRRASERLVREVLGARASTVTVERIVAHAAGHAFFLEELIQAVADHREGQTPPTVLAMVQSRIEAQDAPARRLLRAASIFGDGFSEAAVGHLLGDPGLEVNAHLVDALVEEAILVRAGARPLASAGELAFRHALLREGAYATLTDVDRRAGHRLAGDWLEQAGEHDPMILAGHFERGADGARAAIWYARAAEQALARNDPDAAVARAERAASCGAAGEALGGLRLLQAAAHRCRGDNVGSQLTSLEAMELLPADGEAWLSAAGEAAAASGKLFDLARLRELGKRLEGARAAHGASGQRTIALARAALQCFLCAEPEVGDQLLASALASSAGLSRDPTPYHSPPLAAVQGDLAARAWIEHAHGHRDRLRYLLVRSAAHFETAAACFDQVGDRRNACVNRIYVATRHANLGDPETGVTRLAALSAEADELGLEGAGCFARSFATFAMLVLGRRDEALATAGEATRARPGQPRVSCLAQTAMGLALEAHGRDDEAEAALRAACALGAPALPITVLAAAHLSWLLTRRGSVAEAASLAHAAMERLDPTRGLACYEPIVRLAAIDALRAEGRGEEARRQIEVAHARLRETAAAIEDDGLRRAYLERPPEHARILELWATAVAPRA